MRARSVGVPRWTYVSLTVKTPRERVWGEMEEREGGSSLRAELRRCVISGAGTFQMGSGGGGRVTGGATVDSVLRGSDGVGSCDNMGGSDTGSSADEEGSTGVGTSIEPALGPGESTSIAPSATTVSGIFSPTSHCQSHTNPSPISPLPSPIGTLPHSTLFPFGLFPHSSLLSPPFLSSSAAPAFVPGKSSGKHPPSLSNSTCLRSSTPPNRTVGPVCISPYHTGSTHFHGSIKVQLPIAPDTPFDGLARRDANRRTGIAGSDLSGAG